MRDHGIPVHDARSVEPAALCESLRSLAPDIIVSIANSKILSNDVLKTAKLAALNSHSSLLPRYKGILTGFWHLLNGETEGGVTIHRMDERVDSGDILDQRAFAIGPRETVFSYYRKAAAAGGALWAGVAEALDVGGLAARPNVSGEPAYGKPSSEDRRRFRRRGLSFI
jgi:methionyl-tRNA formyltransferase